ARARPVPPRRPGGRRHRRLLRPGGRVRQRPGRGGRRRRRVRAARGAPGGDARAGRGARAPLPRRGRRRVEARGLHAGRRAGGRRARQGRHPREQRGDRHGGARDPRVAGRVPQGHRHQPQRVLLDGAGVRARDGAGVEHRQHRLRARLDHRGAAAGGVRREQGGDHRAHARPRAAVDGPQGHPRQRAGARVLPVGDDRPVPRGLPRPDDVADPRRARRRRQGAHGGARLPGRRRVELRDRRDAPGRRGHADDV
ncbi:MAG: 3-oxoacyl-[acyl-carrier protein] reductase, partial [uncultured Solirubrobacteraceae bacterium]